MGKRFSLRHLLSMSFMLFFLLVLLGFIPFPLLNTLENVIYDLRVNLTMPNTRDDRVVILDLDDKSLAEVGRWPWSRDTLAAMVNDLFDKYQVAVLGFDVVFAEPDTSAGGELLDRLAKGPLKNDPAYQRELAQLRPELDRDGQFAKSLQNRPTVLGYYFKSVSDNENATSGILPAPLMAMSELSPVAPLPLHPHNGYGANLAVLQESAMGGGFFDNPKVDADGIFRRVPLIVSYQGQVYQSLALGVLRASLGNIDFRAIIDDSMVVNGSNLGLNMLSLSGFYNIPVDEYGSVLVPYRGRERSFPYVSAVDVLKHRVDPEVLRGRMVLLGTTAPGLMDMRSTPVQNVYPGVEIHANIISGILDRTIKHQPGYILGIQFITLIILGVALTYFMPRLSPLMTTVISIALLAGVVGLNIYLWQAVNLVVPLAPPLVFVVSLFVLHMSYGFFVEARSKRQIAKMFGQYVPTELVDEMSLSGQDFTIGGESREMTVLFSDVRGFTSISEGLKPDDLVRLMNAFLTPMTHVIHQHRGTIDKYMGDAIMAFWGAPMADPDHARHALLAGLGMIKAMTDLKHDFAERGWPPLKIGVGLNTGIMNVGNMGSEFRMAYTVLGDAVNLGSRLEGLSKAYGVSIVASEYTKAKVPDMVFRELDRVRVKGKDEPVAIFEPLALASEIDPQIQALVDAYHLSLDYYRKQNWDEAERRLRFIKEQEPERAVLYDVYLGRIAHFREEPPGDNWDGVYTFTTK